MPTVVLFTNKNGTEVSIYETADLAREKACTGIIEPFLSDVPGGGKAIGRLIKKGRYQEALDAWEETQIHTDMPDRIEFFDDLTVGTKPSEAKERRIKCPHCGCDDLDELAVTESYTAYHWIRGGYDSAGVTKLESAWSSTERFDDGEGDYQVSCNKCGKTSDLAAAGIDAVDFV